MELNEHLAKLSPYKVALSFVEDTTIISVVYPKSWTVIEPSNNSIHALKENSRNYYWAAIDTSTDSIFELIYDTIAYNKDIEAKAVLFKQKIKELQQVFIEEDYETLKTLEFKTKKKKQVNKRVSNKTKTEVEEKDMNVDESNDAVIENNVVLENDTHLTLEDTESKVKESTDIDKKIEEAIKEKEG